MEKDSVRISFMPQAILYALIATVFIVVAIRHLKRWLHRLRNEPNSIRSAEKISGVVAFMVFFCVAKEFV
jgi:small-conductance mechanosensitive channel